MQRKGPFMHLISRNKQQGQIMNIITRTIIGATAGIIALAAVSCSKDDVIRYNNATMGNVVDGTFISDQGNIFNVVEQNCTGRLDTMKRAFVVCDILNATAGKENEYDVRLNQIASVLTKEPLIQTEVTDEKLLANDPMIVSSLWISGGYINMYLAIPVMTENGRQHILNCVLDDTATKDGEYTFSFRHNADGEVLKEGNENNSKMVIAGAYASFPLDKIIKEDSAKLKMSWNSYKIQNPGIIMFDTETINIERDYKKTVSSQVPTNSATYSLLSDIE